MIGERCYGCQMNKKPIMDAEELSPDTQQEPSEAPQNASVMF